MTEPVYQHDQMERIIRLGESAQNILESEVYQLALAASKAGVLDSFVTCEPTDTEKLKTIRLQYENIDPIGVALQTFANNGKLMKKELEIENAKTKNRTET